ncbi:iron chaperone [Leifsonia sp. NPDC058194]|uniref:iron chaperone n=1 Tax=Leifsonia sp. NPDC058194 TaxID=3346374 RepID=UPI0036DC7FAF
MSPAQSDDDGFTAEERAAMKERAQEIKAKRASKKLSKEEQAAADAAEVQAKIAEMTPEEQVIARRFHDLVAEYAPSLVPKTWYGMPAYAKGGRNIVFFQPATKFKARYSTIGFNDPAQLDEGTMWATAFAVVELTPADEKIIAALLEKAAG